MNILFVGYWGIDDGLTSATILPHLEILNGFDEIETVFFCTIERDGREIQTKVLPAKVTHIPMQSGWGIMDKVRDFTAIPDQLTKLIRSKKIEGMICRGTPAGALGYLTYRKTTIPYCVESVEPHADYMVESNVWRRWGFRYLLQKHWEKKQYATASLLMPVAGGMVARLAADGIDAQKIKVMPCAVDLTAFSYSEERRKHIRSTLQVTEDTVLGIYVGKFDGLYYDRESFELFKQAKSTFNNFKLIILTPQSGSDIKTKLEKIGFSPSEFRVLKAAHNEVPAYLSAADFAFAPYKKSPFSKFLSPVKVGEYWAIGLPVLLTEGTGDDAEIIERNNVGACFDPVKNNATNALNTIKGILNSDREMARSRIREIAVKYRNFETSKLVYQKVIEIFHNHIGMGKSASL